MVECELPSERSPTPSTTIIPVSQGGGYPRQENDSRPRAVITSPSVLSLMKTCPRCGEARRVDEFARDGVEEVGPKRLSLSYIP